MNSLFKSLISNMKVKLFLQTLKYVEIALTEILKALIAIRHVYKYSAN